MHQANRDITRETKTKEAEQESTLRKRDAEKGQDKINKIIGELENEVECFCSTTGKAYIQITEGEENRVVIPIASKQFQNWFRNICYQYFQLILPSEGERKAQAHFEMLAEVHGKRKKLYRRIAKTGNAIYYDCIREDGRILKITKETIRYINNCKVTFIHSAVHASQSKADFTQKPDYLKYYIHNRLNLKNEQQEILLSAFLVSCFWGDEIFHPIIQMYGEKGASKSTCMERIQSIIDPHTIGLYALSHKVDDVALLLGANFMTIFDNVSSIPWTISDLFCRTCTKGVQSKRKLFHDEEQVYTELNAVICFNGTSQNVVRSDLADRTIFIQLERIAPEQMLSPSQMKKEWEEDLPRVFGALCRTVQGVLGDTEAVETKSPFRLRDFYDIAVKAARQLGYDRKKVEQAFRENRKIINEAVISSIPLLTILEEYMKQTGNKGKIEGTPTEFYKDLKLFAIEECGVDGRSFPKSSAVLTRRMNENKSNLEDIGIYFDTPRGKNRRIRIWRQ